MLIDHESIERQSAALVQCDALLSGWVSKKARSNKFESEILTAARAIATAVLVSFRVVL
jgi:hypothetical protein